MRFSLITLLAAHERDLHHIVASTFNQPSTPSLSLLRCALPIQDDIEYSLFLVFLLLLGYSLRGRGKDDRFGIYIENRHVTLSAPEILPRAGAPLFQPPPVYEHSRRSL
jgi:hypothetical protein